MSNHKHDKLNIYNELMTRNTMMFMLCIVFILKMNNVFTDDGYCSSAVLLYEPNY